MNSRQLSPGTRAGICLAIVVGSASALLSAQPDDPAPARRLPPESAASPDGSLAPPAGAIATPLRLLPGLQPAGNIQLPNQWSLRPAGTQVEVGDFPVNIALHPEGKWAAVLCAGYSEHEVIVLDLKTRKKTDRVIVPESFYGLTFDAAGKRLYASGGQKEVVHSWQFDGGLLSDHRVLKISGIEETHVPAGLALSTDGQTLLAACCWGQSLCQLGVDGDREPKHIAMPADSHPYAVLPAPDGKTAYVSLWAKSAVAEVDLQSQSVKRMLPTDSHPTEMLFSPDGKLLYVACANSNVVIVIDLAEGKPIETISSALYPGAPSGSTPNSISLSPDGRVLLVANADNNDVAMIDVSEPGHSRSLGFLPVGWYPTSVRFTHDGRTILVANGKGLWPKPNRNGPKPTQAHAPKTEEYIAGLFKGEISFVSAPSPEQMAAYTRQAIACSPLRADASARAEKRDENNPIPAKLGGASPIKHCIYIIKENRTYDQVFGDVREGNGDTSLCLFPEEVSPNHHALARQFVLLDNFYVESEVSADGHEWTMAAYATDFVEKLWPLDYRGNGGDKMPDKIGYPSEGTYPTATPKGGYLWDRAREANVSYFSFGEFIANAKEPDQPGHPRVAALEGHFDPLYRSFDLDYPDQKRVDRYASKLAEYERDDNMPQLIVLRLPNDHTSGTKEDKLTPKAYVADNDLALGRLVEAVSKSRFWPETAIFVVEDDAQNGSDHVDAHRTVALVISPYTKHGYVDSSLYSTSSMLRSMELVLGLAPMSQFDAAALPMYASFQATPNLAPYEHVPARIDLKATNPPDAPGAAQSARMDFTEEDKADDLALNEVIWKSVKGAASPMPPPVRAAFVFTPASGEKEDGDE